ncbi:hypothetical protein WAI453_003493 [Rhynchosporium graminicola]|uniref:Related to gamma-butyrobetaine dioxygenase n=1 Tax=Rhynchosporium graminicola TaxID=2792576 RepID=A0A1E1KPH0_9HELO|nr:related to gamma-butyrobetaine dioxygenase [Rhynchosporium commune]
MSNSRLATSQEDWQAARSPDGNPDLNLEYVKIGTDEGAFHPVFLRDACPCPKCIDSSTTQKLFQTTDIPAHITAESVNVQENGDVTIKWKNDLPASGPDHISTYSASLIKMCSNRTLRLKGHFSAGKARIWDNSRISEELEFVNFDDYMKDDKYLFRAVAQLKRLGLLLVRNVPESEEAVAQIAERIGTIRDTFYGRTWNVKSVPEAKNVAYTHQSLGLHMDLQYMHNPPGFQLLHCLKNTCEGGDSLFSDAFYAASRLSERDVMTLTRTNLAYQYRNAGEHYYMERPVLEVGDMKLQTPGGLHSRIEAVNYSPPFQAPLPISKAHQGYLVPRMLEALRQFARNVESPYLVHRYRLKAGECVMFNNRRVLHGRDAFEPGNGERLLKGTYLDTDVLNSKWRTLNKQFNGVQPAFDDGQHVYQENWEKRVGGRFAQ